MRTQVFLSILFITIAFTANAKEKVCEALELVTLAESFNGTDKEKGQAICGSYNMPYCERVKGLGEGICRALDGSYCERTESLGEGICRASRGSYCERTANFGEGLCRAVDGVYCERVRSNADQIKWRLRILREFCDS